MVFDKKEWSKQYHEKNREKKRKYDKLYREKNNKRLKQQKQEYQHTPQWKKSYTISKWKHRGLKLHGYTY